MSFARDPRMIKAMKKILPALISILLCVFLISACSSASGTPDTNQPMLARDAAGSYSAEFRLQFNGAKNWSYLLKTRKSQDLREISLHIEGLQGAQNPGDIRMLTDNTTTWMIGEGTDQQCVQFPNGQGMDPTYIYPESLISLKSLGSALKPMGEEQLAGVAMFHFSAAAAASGPWKDANIDFWQEKSSGALRQFNMTATGEDPFFAGGIGKLTAGYTAGPLGSEAISPVAGCEISVPLPETISKFVRLPGMASFESRSSVEELVKFYQKALPEQKWAEKEALVQAKGGTALSYQRGAESVEIHIEMNPAGGSAVKLLFIQGP
jgi:hypothetical protein